MSGISDHVVMIGTASKGIIERDFQHNAQVGLVCFFHLVSRWLIFCISVCRELDRNAVVTQPVISYSISFKTLENN